VAGVPDDRETTVTSSRTGPELTVDLGAVAWNVRRFCELGPTMAVVKADAFGHGAVPVARTAIAHGAQALGVTTAQEAIALRDAGVTAPILSWLNPPGAELGDAVARDVTFAVADRALLDAVAAAAAATGVVAQVHLHVDTGMARDGAPEVAWRSLCERAREHEQAHRVRVTGVMGHLARAAEPDDPSNRRAVDTLQHAIVVARAHGFGPLVRHLAATAGALDLPSTRFDLLRVGAGLYGIDPSGGRRLRRALRLTAPIVLARDVDAGTGVGYGHTYVTPAPTRLALVPVGYADGVPPAAAGRAQVQVRGRRCPVVGAVSMDQTVIDVGDLPVEAGEIAVLFGAGDDGEPTTGDWSRWCAIPEHAVMTGIGARVRRVVRAAAPPPPTTDHGPHGSRAAKEAPIHV
jgi:alanine racemase